MVKDKLESACGISRTMSSAALFSDDDNDDDENLANLQEAVAPELISCMTSKSDSVIQTNGTMHDCSLM